MKSPVIGLFCGFGILFYAFTNTGRDSYAYFDVMSILIVFGGSISVSVMTNGFYSTLKICLLFFKVFKTQKYDNLKIIKEVVEVSKKHYYGNLNLNSLEDGLYHPFVHDGLRLIHNKFDEVKIRKLLINMTHQRQLSHDKVIEQIESLSKYPPAFGMMGTIIGLIAVLKEISTAEGVATIGPSMAVALVTTLYGIILSNYLLQPIADNLYSRSHSDIMIRQLISEGIILLAQGHDPVYIREALLSYLAPEDRAQYSKTNGMSSVAEEVAA